MAKKRMERIERLLQAGQWSEARDLLEQERVSRFGKSLAPYANRGHFV